MPAFGDHSTCESGWADDRSDSIVCPRCSGVAFRRWRYNFAGGHPLHRHEVIACVPCGTWAAVCHETPVPQPDLEGAR